MRKIVILAMSIGIILTACKSNEPSEKIIRLNSSSHIQSKEHIPYLQWIMGDYEAFVHYSFLDGASMKDPIYGFVSRYAGVNTIMLNENVGIKLRDTCTVENRGDSTIFHITREAIDIINRKPNEVSKRSPAQVQEEISIASLNFDITAQTATPIYFIRPTETRCNKIPLCYYEDMEIEWNPDTHNYTGVVIIAEWNGITLDGTSVDTTVVHSVQVDDDGVTTLPTSIFNGMPDEALVNLWLIRANIEITESHQNVTLDDYISIANEDPDSLRDFIYANPESICILQTLSIATGAVTVMPIYLIRVL